MALRSFLRGEATALILCSEFSETDSVTRHSAARCPKRALVVRTGSCLAFSARRRTQRLLGGPMRRVSFACFHGTQNHPPDHLTVQFSSYHCLLEIKWNRFHLIVVPEDPGFQQRLTFIVPLAGSL